MGVGVGGVLSLGQDVLGVCTKAGCVVSLWTVMGDGRQHFIIANKPWTEFHP